LPPLAGAWTEERDGIVTSEHWCQRGDRLLGIGEVRGAASGREVLLIEPRGGRLVFEAWPAGQALTAYDLERADEREAVFANPAHDFPQRIRYRRDGDRLLASAEAPDQILAWTLGPDPAARPLCGRLVERTATVAAPPAAVYEAFTTEAGIKTFFAPEARVDLRIGGAYELYFDPEAPPGQRGGEGCTVQGLVPAERLAVTWNFPPSLPSIRGEFALVDLRFEPAADGGTRVSLLHRGFPTGPDGDAAIAYFERAWGIVLERLARRFATGPLVWAAE
jgi:uncharacterized protein YndB with AHSA1/START domain